LIDAKRLLREIAVNDLAEAERDVYAKMGASTISSIAKSAPA
jgi:hypothetical protein